MEPIDIYTSTGVKFWRHPEQMMSWILGRGKSVISTHISPEGRCNLNCDYCSVANRKKYDRLSMDTIMKYITDLIPRGLKAVILTGGGEPTLWPEWNTLIGYLAQYKLRYGLITNGVDLKGKDLHIFDWIRVSINAGAARRMDIDRSMIKDDCTIGASYVFGGKNKEAPPAYVVGQANRIVAEYIRVLPDCLPEYLEEAHKEIDEWLHREPVVDGRWIHQYKDHRAPNLLSCPQAYFRPYLSEVDGGTVFPCDSLVLNDKIASFSKKYALCKPKDVLDFLDGKITQRFKPVEDCKGCVFYGNVMMLNNFRNGIHQFGRFNDPIKHEEFI